MSNHPCYVDLFQQVGQSCVHAHSQVWMLHLALTGQRLNTGADRIIASASTTAEHAEVLPVQLLRPILLRQKDHLQQNSVRRNVHLCIYKTYCGRMVLSNDSRQLRSVCTLSSLEICALHKLGRNVLLDRVLCRKLVAFSLCPVQAV